MGLEEEGTMKMQPYLSGRCSPLHYSLLIYFTPFLMTSTHSPLFLTYPPVSGCFSITTLLSFAFFTPFILHTFQLFPICCPLVSFHLPPAKAAKITLARLGTENQTVVIQEPSLSWLQSRWSRPGRSCAAMATARRWKQKAEG